jgi:hypothetical protein
LANAVQVPTTLGGHAAIAEPAEVSAVKKAAAVNNLAFIS